MLPEVQYLRTCAIVCSFLHEIVTVCTSELITLPIELQLTAIFHDKAAAAKHKC